jgi:hypothetical protein
VCGVIVADRAGSPVGDCTKTPCLTSTSSRQVKPHRSVRFPEPEFPVVLQLVDLRRKSRRVWQPKKPVENFFVLAPEKELFFSGKIASPNHQVRFDSPFVEIESLRRSNSTRLKSNYNIIAYVMESVDTLKISPPGQSCPQESRWESRSASCVQSGPSVSCVRRPNAFIRSNTDAEAQETTSSFFDCSSTPR